MEIFKYSLSVDFVAHVYKSFKNKHSVIRMIHNYFLKKINIKGKTIDLGSGDGSNLSYYNFMEINKDELDKLDYFRKSEIKIDLEKSLTINNNKYDNVILFNTLEHIENYKNLVSEIFRILKNNGNLELFVPFLVMYHPDPKDIFRPTQYYLKKILHDQGFNVNITSIGVGPFIVAYQSIYRFLKIPILQTFFFILFELLNRVVRIFSKDFSNYYCGLHASCNKKINDI